MEPADRPRVGELEDPLRPRVERAVDRMAEARQPLGFLMAGAAEDAISYEWP